MKKRPALLLEVLLAMTILALSATLLIRQPILIHRAEVAQLERIECDRIAAWTYTEIREKFLKGEVPWSKIPPLKGKSPPISLSETPFELPPLISRTASRTYFIETLREKQTPDDQKIKLIAIHIDIGAGRKKRRFTYQMNLSHS